MTFIKRKNGYQLDWTLKPIHVTLNLPLIKVRNDIIHIDIFWYASDINRIVCG